MPTKILEPRFEQFEPRLLMSGGPTFTDLLDPAVNVDINPAGTVVLSDTISLSGYADYYQFTAPASGKVRLEMVADDGSSLDSLLEVFSSNGQRIARNDNAARGVLDSRIVLSVKEGQTFFVKATGRNGTTGAYNLRVTSNPRDDYGNTFETAKAVRLRSSGAGAQSGTVNYGQDVDVFSIVATRTGQMTVDMTALGRGSFLDGEMFAYDADGNLLVYNDDTVGLNPRVAFDVTAGSKYYIEAGSLDNSTGRYIITISTAQPQPNPNPDPNPNPSPNPNPDPQPNPDPTDPQPGSVITAESISTAAGTMLRVLGTNGDDTITMSAIAGGLSLVTAAGTYTYSGSFASIVIYGFAGNDTIRLTNTVTIAAEIYGGDGNDSIYASGSGRAVVNGQAGNDLLVAVGGGGDVLNGGDGTDSFWADTADTIGDASADETGKGYVHRIAEFYQPYTTDQSSASYVSLEIAGQNLTDPTSSYAYRNFASTPLFVDGAQYDDIAQGAVGDCYYLATLASIADTDPTVVEQMVAPLGDGTYAVRFYRGGSEVYLRVDGDLPTSASGNLAYAKTGKDGELWVPIVEKAYAYFRYGMNSYASISGGWMSDVYSEVANCSAPWRYTSGSAASLYNAIASALAAGHPVTMGSYSNASGPIVGSHAYMVKTVQTTPSGQYVTVYNPWGYDGRSWDSNSSDGLLTISIAQVQQYFQAVVFATV